MTDKRKNTSEVKKIIDDEGESNGGSKGKVYVLESLDRIEEKVDSVEEKRRKCELSCTQELTKLKVKSTVGGAIAGFIGSVIITFVISLSAGFITNTDLKEYIQQDNQPRIEKKDDRNNK